MRGRLRKGPNKKRRLPLATRLLALQRKSAGVSQPLSYICDDGDAQVSHVGDDLTVFRWDLSVLDQLVQVLLCDACTHEERKFISVSNKTALKTH